MKEENNAHFVKWFSTINKDMFSIAGFKGANLGELFSNHLPVPNGFVVTSEAYVDFLSSSGINDKIDELLSKANPDEPESFSDIVFKIKGLITSAEFSEELKEDIIDYYQALGADKIEIGKGSAKDILNSASEPSFVSIRSSICFKSHRGDAPREQDTYLNVKGNDEIIDHIKNAFASLFNTETIRREMKKGVKISDLKIAVIVQKMVNSEKSGFVLSRDSSRSISLYSIWGIGEGMNLKGVTPDKCVLSRDLSVTEKRTGQKNFYVVRSSSGALKAMPSSEERKNSEVLNNYEIQRLGDLAEKIESHFGVPQKIDFAIDESGIYVMQSEETDIQAKKEELKVSPDKKTNDTPKKSYGVGKIEKVTKTKMKLILDSPFILEEGEATGLKRIGLFEIEKMIEKIGKHPLYFLDSHYINEYENLIYEGVNLVAGNFEEVTVRTSDFLSDRFSNLQGSRNIKENNPLLGLHGIRFSLKYPDIIEAELRALKRASQKSDIGILIPNVVSISELNEVKSILKKIGFENARLGVMIETPAAIQLIKEFCEEKVSSIVINSERLLEYLLAVDRENDSVSVLFDEMNPAFLYQIEYMIRVAKRNGVETDFIMPSNGSDELLKYLVRKGVDFVLANPYEAKEVSEKIYSFESEFIHGTDSEPRKYEMGKMKEEYLKGESKSDSNQLPNGL